MQKWECCSCGKCLHYFHKVKLFKINSHKTFWCFIRVRHMKLLPGITISKVVLIERYNIIYYFVSVYNFDKHIIGCTISLLTPMWHEKSLEIYRTLNTLKSNWDILAYIKFFLKLKAFCMKWICLLIIFYSACHDLS